MLIGGAFAAIAVVLITLYLRSQQKEIAALLVAAGVLLLFSISLSHTSSAIDWVWKMVNDSKYTSEVETMLKALGIAATAQITADICRTAGEPTVASHVEIIGKMEILLLALPLAARLLSFAQTLLV